VIHHVTGFQLESSWQTTVDIKHLPEMDITWDKIKSFLGTEFESGHGE
jgi:hypothetical protein